MTDGQSTDGIEQFEFRDVVSGEYCEAKTDSESVARQLAAQSIGADASDLRRIYDHSGREPEDTEEADRILEKALGYDLHNGFLDGEEDGNSRSVDTGIEQEAE
jgi:hypothetical protein